METLRNYRNFCNSAAPARFFYFSDGRWLPFSDAALSEIKLAFSQGKTAFQVRHEDSGTCMLLNILCMSAIDVESGNVTSLAWIDSNGLYFFPRQNEENENEDTASSSNSEVLNGENEIKESECSAGLVKLRDCDEGFRFVKALFLNRMSSYRVDMVGVYRVKHSTETLDSFALEGQNLHHHVRYAWHHPCFSRSKSLANENGEHHLVLCRLIVDETVRRGKCSIPNSERRLGRAFVMAEDMFHPTLYCIRSELVRTHVLDEYVVCFKRSLTLTDSCERAKANSLPGRGGGRCRCARSFPEKRGSAIGRPMSAWLSFPKLLTVIEKFIPSSEYLSLNQDYSLYKEGTISRDDFIGRVRLVAGDNLLIKAIRTFQCKQLSEPNRRGTG